MSKKRRIPMSCLGPKALDQIRAAGYDVDKQIARERSGVRKLAGAPMSFLSRDSKFGVSKKEERTVDNVTFASKLEANAYRFLKERKVTFDCQVPFELEESFEHDGKHYRAIRYVSDFIIDPSGKRLVVDMKGVTTPIYLLKQKLMVKKYGIQVICLKSVAELAGLLHAHGLMFGSATT